MPCGGSAKLADGISSMASSVVGPWGMMTDDVGADVGIGMDFCRFGCASALLRLCTLLGPQQRLARGHRHLLVVELEHLVRLPMYPFVATK